MTWSLKVDDEMMIMGVTAYWRGRGGIMIDGAGVARDLQFAWDPSPPILVLHL